jgi:DNA-directed RNA polymerase specialized sigma24 family protein
MATDSQTDPADSSQWRAAVDIQLENALADAVARIPEVREARLGIDRLIEDADLLLELQLCGFEGREWERFRNRLARYGFQVIRAWCVNGRIFRECRRKMGPKSPRAPKRALSLDEAAEVAAETVARALNYFVDEVLRRHRWDPRKGASLSTFFVGACILSFPNELSRLRAEYKPLPLGPGEDIPHTVFSADAIIAAREVLDAMKPRARTVVLRHGAGFTYKEIAQRTGLTVKGVDTLLTRRRRGSA